MDRINEPLPERDEAADDDFRVRFDAHRLDLARLCRRMLGRTGTAEDAASEVYLRARLAFKTYRPEQPFRPWLLAIASHHCIDQLRRRRTERRIFDARDLDTADLAGPGPSPLGLLERSRERSQVLAAIDSLDLKYRLPLVLRYYSELDYADMAEVLGVKRGQVGTLLFRAKRRLRSALEEPEAGSAAAGDDA